jgi:hypothetical protein
MGLFNVCVGTAERIQFTDGYWAWRAETDGDQPAAIDE